MKCSNCEQPVNLTTSLLLYEGTKTEPVAAICNECQSGVTVLKIVLERRLLSSPFTYAGYLPVSSMKTIG